MTDERNRQPYDSVLDTIGWTPLIRLQSRDARNTHAGVRESRVLQSGRIGKGPDRVCRSSRRQSGKASSSRAGRSSKARAETPESALAIAAALRGYKCIFTMPDKMSQEKVRLLKAFGAEVIITPTAVPPDHPDSYVMMAKRIAKETPNAILADQFYNDANPQAHYDDHRSRALGADRRADHALRCGGGNGRHDHRRRPLPEGKESEDQDHCRRSGRLDPRRSTGAPTERNQVEGVPYKVEGIGQDKIPGTLDMSVIDDFQTVSDKDSFAMARRLTREEGLFVGGSSGLITHVALNVARRGRRSECIRRDGAVRHRRALSLQALQRRVDAREPDARSPRVTLSTCSAERTARCASGRERRAGRDGAAGARAHGAARRLAAAGDGWRRTASDRSATGRCRRRVSRIRSFSMRQ